MKKVRLNSILFSFAIGLLLAANVIAQSTTQEFPTAIVSNEVSGTIKARDLGDSRLTTYYYALSGDQGDLFINLVTRNFTGDIDVFTVNGLRPMTKIVVYADYAETETGRAIYLRKPEKLLLRIQGRTPNDDAATFRLKFAGSFVAARVEDTPVEPELPKVTAESRSGIRVNSVGTLLPPLPKAAESVAEKEKTEADPLAKTVPTDEAKPADPDKAIAWDEPKAKVELVVNDPIKAEEKPEGTSARRKTPTRRRSAPKRSEPKKTAEKTVTETSDVADNPATERKAETPSVRTLLKNRRDRTPKKPAEPKPDPLASINLVIQFKDGNSLEKKMSEVFKFSVDKGVLTVILKDGSVSRYPIADVAKVTIE